MRAAAGREDPAEAADPGDPVVRAGRAAIALRAAARPDAIVVPAAANADPGPTGLAPTGPTGHGPTGSTSGRTAHTSRPTATSAQAIALSGRRSRGGPIADRAVTGATDNGRPNTVDRVGEAGRRRSPAVGTARAIGSRGTNAGAAEASDRLSGLRRPAAVNPASGLDTARGRVVPKVGTAAWIRVASEAGARIVARGRSARLAIGRGTDRRTNARTDPGAGRPTGGRIGNGPIGDRGTGSRRATISPRARKVVRLTNRPRPRHPRADIKSWS
jgi:hypothetical protein